MGSEMCIRDSPDGETILDLISRHRRSVDYARALENAGAKKTAAAGN